MLKRVLVANRGEVALRVIAACRELSVETVAVCSTADRRALHARAADRAVCIGPAPAERSYLDVAAIIEAARLSGADAVHPGYGFLAESADLAEACGARGIVFVGPPPAVLRLFGDKVAARAAMRRAGLPVLPGAEVPVDAPAAVLDAAQSLGYPVIVKARGGGGGRGMRIVPDAASLETAWRTAQREAQAAFGDSRLYLERYLAAARHIEFQVLVDGAGTSLSLGERECTIQRRHQKLLEESPSPAVDEPTRRELGARIARAARAVGYRNAGTFEFLRDESGTFHFIEVNARLQVEHPVTEMVTGVDIVKEQLRIAGGQELSTGVGASTPSGHAIECRINAEHPETFRPSPGTIAEFTMQGGTGPGVRVDTDLRAGGVVTPHYDSLVAKVVAHGHDRREAIARMRRALTMTVIDGIDTTIPLHLRILSDPDFVAGRVSTAFLERFASGSGAAPGPRAARGG
ncbi:MAG: acetyl-CoA carboxylase biotin carboxylase subunit [Acidobacteria bacterium]|nr:acetyl-CoA carboxylase biotin carboxylase subunit [Acidobacteriota bacterium]